MLVVEGYLDAIALAQYGRRLCRRHIGDGADREHVRALSRYTKNIVALFDGDDAGLKAAARSFEIFVEAGMLGRAAFLPKGEDPDTFIRSQGQSRAGNYFRSSGAVGRFLFLLARTTSR